MKTRATLPAPKLAPAPTTAEAVPGGAARKLSPCSALAVTIIAIWGFGFAVGVCSERHLQSAPAGSYPGGASPAGVRQLIGDVWEWTSSDFLPYPGFTAWPYREYSEVFFGSEYKMLRGGSFGVAPVACRGTFRNWDYPIRRQIFAGFRTARDAEPAAGAEALR